MALEFQNFLQKQLPAIPAKSAQAVLELHKEGATVPFIARYRKEKTGNLDEVAVKEVIESFELYNEVIKRQAFIVKEIESQGNLTSELKTRVLATLDLAELEEIYRPFKKKKKTKATVAREAGLEPFANWIWDLGHGTIEDKTTLEVKAKEFLNPAAKFVTYDTVLKGAQDILIEKVSNNTDLRAMLLKDVLESGKIVSKKAKEFKAHSKYEMYAEFEEPIKKIREAKASHRYLAMRRGWQENELTVTIEPGHPDEVLKQITQFACTKPNSQAAEFLDMTVKLAYSAHMLPSIVNEVHSQLKDLADQHAIQVFTENVRRLLLASPFGSKCVLGCDPGLRTGCKIALVDKSGHFLSHTVLHIQGEGAEAKATALFSELFKTVQVEAIAVGNGTAGRETETFLRKVLTSLGSKVPVVMVNESGASVYSASDVAREEFPDLDLTVRGAVSIARRLQDPLAELVKIDPKSIGVGQYQHDVSQTKLKKSLDFVVESCVNSVGIDINTASPYLLSYVSGIGPALAKNIVEHRKTAGLFTDREALQNVPRFSAKAFEQCAGFLRVYNGKNVLDQTGIHPERYSAVREMASDLGLTTSQLVGEGVKKLLEQRTKWVELVGQFTFDDIVRELEKPGRDPRDPFKVFAFRDDIFEVKDLKESMICPGIVTNVTNFGAFVDVGVHQDGLVHISELADKFVDDPRKVVNPGDQVTVKVLKVDLEKNQISLTMRLQESQERRARSVSEAETERPRRPHGDQPRGPRSGQNQGPRGPRNDRPRHASGKGPQGESRGQQPPGKHVKPHDSRRPQGGNPGGKQDDRNQRPPKTPFNNSFGSLANLLKK